MENMEILPRHKDRIALYLRGVANGCEEAAGSSDFRLWLLMAAVLRRVRPTLDQITQEEAAGPICAPAPEERSA